MSTEPLDPYIAADRDRLADDATDARELRDQVLAAETDVERAALLLRSFVIEADRNVFNRAQGLLIGAADNSDDPAVAQALKLFEMAIKMARGAETRAVQRQDQAVAAREAITPPMDA